MMIVRRTHGRGLPRPVRDPDVEQNLRHLLTLIGLGDTLPELTLTRRDADIILRWKLTGAVEQEYQFRIIGEGAEAGTLELVDVTADPEVSVLRLAPGGTIGFFGATPVARAVSPLEPEEATPPTPTTVDPEPGDDDPADLTNGAVRQMNATVSDASAMASAAFGAVSAVLAYAQAVTAILEAYGLAEPAE
jgi:hypothetical protein